MYYKLWTPGDVHKTVQRPKKRESIGLNYFPFLDGHSGHDHIPAHNTRNLLFFPAVQCHLIRKVGQYVCNIRVTKSIIMFVCSRNLDVLPPFKFLHLNKYCHSAGAIFCLVSIIDNGIFGKVDTKISDIKSSYETDRRGRLMLRDQVSNHHIRVQISNNHMRLIDRECSLILRYQI